MDDTEIIIQNKYRMREEIFILFQVLFLFNSVETEIYKDAKTAP